jgi:hypothetical protein
MLQLVIMSELSREYLGAAIACTSYKGKLGIRRGGEAKGHKPNRYDRLHAHLGELSAAEVEALQPIDLSSKQVRMLKRAANFVINHPERITKDLKANGERVQSTVIGLWDERSQSVEEVENKAFDVTLSMVFNAAGLRDYLSQSRTLVSEVGNDATAEDVVGVVEDGRLAGS